MRAPTAASIPRGPTLRWFVARALDGFAPKLAIVDAILATISAVVIAAVWRLGGGARASYEQIVPILGTGLRWSVALPIAWAALSALEADRRDGLLDLARRRGIPLRRFVIGRAVGAGTLVLLTVGGPMVILSLVIAGFGGGVEGMLARLSLVVPALLVGLATALVFGVGGVVLGVLVPSRPIALAFLIAAASVGALVDLAVPGLVGATAHQLVSPFLALEDLQALLFDVPRSTVRGVAAAFAILIVPLLGLRAAEGVLVARTENP
ncbi:MAG: hypothetical protein ACXVEF_14625 [Polyangiales bacterium]